MLVFAEGLRSRGAGLRVLNLGGGDGDTSTLMGAMVFTIMAGLGQMEYEIKRERVVDSINKRRDAGQDLGGRPRTITDSQIRSAQKLVEGEEPVAQVARDLGMSRATFYRRSRALQSATNPNLWKPPVATALWNRPWDMKCVFEQQQTGTVSRKLHHA